MPTRAQVCAWILAFGVWTPSIAAAQDRTEGEIVEMILRDGSIARAIRAETDVTRREQLTRLAYPNPTVSYSREGAGFTEFLQLEQALPVFGTRAALTRAGVAATAAAEAERDARLWILRTEAAISVATLLAEQSRFELATAHSQEISRLIEVLRTREREGEGSRFDRLRGEQELRDAQQRLTSAAIALDGARAAVSAMLPPEVAIGRIIGALYAPQTTAPLDRLTARASAARADVRALRHAGEQADLETDAARRARLPVPAISGGLKRASGASGHERGGVFGLSMSLPLFDAGARDAARWAAERARVDAERLVLEQRLHLEIARASHALALRHTDVAQDEEASADELTRIAGVAYREGEVGILELLDAFRTATRARFRSIDLRLDARLAQLALERAVGDVLWP